MPKTTPEPCLDCQKLAEISMLEQHERMAWLRRFYETEPDEFLTVIYHICRVCGQLWLEDNSSYNEDFGWFWKRRSWAQFLQLEGENLPDYVEKTAVGCQQWLTQFEGYYSVELFRSVYRDEESDRCSP